MFLTNTSAGVVGLYTVFELIQNGVEPSSIEVIAQHLPGDLSIDYASPYAGAYFTALADPEWLKYAKYSYNSLPRLKAFLGGVGVGLSDIFVEEHVLEPLDRTYVESLKEFIPGLQTGPSTVPGCLEYIHIKGYNFNSPKLLQSMFSKFQSLGVKFVRDKLTLLEKCFGEETLAVFNCTGNGAYKLVNDAKVYPVRGQVVVVRAPHIKIVKLAWRPTSSTYLIPRPDSDEVILGGFYQPGNMDANTYGYETEDILRRTTDLFPELLTENADGRQLSDLRILRVVAGARPGRSGGARIEREDTAKGPVFHNYGAAGCGYTCGLGMAHYSVSQLFPMARL